MGVKSFAPALKQKNPKENHIFDAQAILSKGFLQSGILGEVCVLEGGSLGRRFLAKFGGDVSGDVWGEVFAEVFGLVLLGHSKKLQPKISVALHSKTGENSGKHLMTHRVLQGVAQRGAQFYFIFAVLRTLLSCSKMSLFYTLKLAPPEGSRQLYAREVCAHVSALIESVSKG